MKNLATVLVLLFLATLVVLLWRLEGRLEPMAELARAQLADRAEARLAEQNRIAAEGRARARQAGPGRTVPARPACRQAGLS